MVEAYPFARAGLHNYSVMINSTAETIFTTDDGIPFTRGQINQNVAAYNAQYAGAPRSPLCPPIPEL